jgi:hypothetical protein
MTRIGPATLLLAASLGVAFGQQSQPTQGAEGRSSYDPMPHASGSRQPKGIVEPISEIGNLVVFCLKLGLFSL